MARIALVGAIGILLLKTGAWLVTGSVALASDAAESIVNVVAAVTLLVALRISRTPPDLEHRYGHEKIEDLSSAFEAGLILLASLLIAGTAVDRLFTPVPLDQPLVGLVLAGASALVNALLALWLARTARATDSTALRANAKHLATDVLTSVGVLAGVAGTWLTGFERLDPLIALLVALQIARTGVTLLRRSISRLLDERLPEQEEDAIDEILSSHPDVLGYHRLYTRRSGRTRFVEVDVFVDPAWTVQRAHDLVVELEDAMAAKLGTLRSTVHVEPFVPGRREGTTPPVEEYPPESGKRVNREA